MHEIAARRIIQTPIGRISIAASEQGITNLDFLSSRSRLQDFATTALAQSLVDQAAKQLVEYFEGKREKFDLKFDLDGTAFQKSVWQQIQKIPFGKTVSYGEIARAIRKPQAARAVGGAVGANPVAIFIACHRVMGSTGKLTGYSGGNGLPTKRKLLDLEGIKYR
jgi:methylated-DNA-[protein]-cysteine S-methyltransferase